MKRTLKIKLFEVEDFLTYQNTRITKTIKERLKCRYFSLFFSSVFRKGIKITIKTICEELICKKAKIDDERVKVILAKVQTNEACGTDNIGNTVLRNHLAQNQGRFEQCGFLIILEKKQPNPNF